MPLPGVLILAFVLGLAGGPVAAEIWHVAASGSDVAANPDGSEEAPWPSIRAALGSGRIKGGDEIVLADGEHGILALNGTAFDRPVTIRSASGRNAHLQQIVLRGPTRNITLRDLSVWPDSPDGLKGAVVLALPATSDITARGLDVRSSEDALDFFSWDLSQWNRRKFNGIQLRGARSAVLDSAVTAVRMGIMVEGANSTIQNSSVNGFSGDGLRGIGDGDAIIGNRVTNCFKIDKNHDDGFQSWSPRRQPNAVISGLLIDSNTIIEWTGPAGHPLQCRLQGIGMFDGFYDHVVIQNNVISVSAYHGITVNGGRDLRIINNTVVSNSGKSQKNPWIMVTNHKNGGKMRDVIVGNNLAMSFKVPVNRTQGISGVANSVIRSPAGAFVDVSRFDYRPVKRSGFVDSAEPTLAPALDNAGVPRSVGAGPDRGALEAPQ